MQKDPPFNDLVIIGDAVWGALTHDGLLSLSLPLAYILQCVIAGVCLHIANAVEIEKLPNGFKEPGFARKVIARHHEQAARFLLVSGISLFTFAISLTFRASPTTPAGVVLIRSYSGFAFVAVQVFSLIRSSRALHTELRLR